MEKNENSVLEQLIQKVIESSLFQNSDLNVSYRIEDFTPHCSCYMSNKDGNFQLTVDKNYIEIFLRLFYSFRMTYPAGAFLAGVDFILSKRRNRNSVIKFGLQEIYREPFTYLNKYDASTGVDLLTHEVASELREMAVTFLISHEIGHFLLEDVELKDPFFKEIYCLIQQKLPSTAKSDYVFFNQKFKVTEISKEITGNTIEKNTIEEAFCDALGIASIFEYSIKNNQPLEFSMGMIRFFLITNHLLYEIDKEAVRLEDISTRFRRSMRQQLMKIRIVSVVNIFEDIYNHYKKRGLNKESDYSLNELLSFMLDLSFFNSEEEEIDYIMNGTPTFKSYEDLFLQLARKTEKKNNEATFVGLASLKYYLVDIAKSALELIEDIAKNCNIDVEQMEKKIISK